MGKNTKTTQKARDAVTGRYVTLKYAKNHPATTVVETKKRPKSKKK